MSGHLARISTFREGLSGVERLFTSYAGTPQPLVDGILHLLIVRINAVTAQIVYLIFTCEGHITSRCDYLNLRRKNLKCKVKTHLIITSSCRTVSHRIGPYLLGILYNGNCLEYTFRRHRNRISAVTEHISSDHVADTLFVIILSNIKRGM